MIGNLSRKVSQIQNIQTISLDLEIPKVLEHKINKESLVLSKYKETFQSNQSFINIINLLYLLANQTEVDDFSKTLNVKLAYIENFIEIYDSNLNFYKVLKEITFNLKKNHYIYTSLKRHSNTLKFTFNGLSNEFTPLIEYLHILNKTLMAKSNNTELMIDVEIINHKIDILKTLSDNI